VKKFPPVKKTNVVRTYYILPCCLLLLNVCNSLISYKAGLIDDPIVRVCAIIFFILVGSSLVAFHLLPALYPRSRIAFADDLPKLTRGNLELRNSGKSTRQGQFAEIHSGMSVPAFLSSKLNSPKISCGVFPDSRRVRRLRASWRLARRTPLSSTISGQ